MADLYEVLQVSPSAEPEVIRAAFRALARKHHPDFGGDQHQMMAINEAWNVLGDRQRRSAYDASRGGLRQRTNAVAQRNSTSAHPPVSHRSERGPLAAAAERAADRVAERAETRQEAGTAGRGEAPGDRPYGTVLDFGRYAGWSVRELGTHDPDYLQWLQRTPIGRSFKTEIEQVLEARGLGSAPAATASRTIERRRSSGFRFRAR